MFGAVFYCVGPIRRITEDSEDWVSERAQYSSLHKTGPYPGGVGKKPWVLSCPKILDASWLNFNDIHPFTYPFVQQILVECLLCARHFSRSISVPFFNSNQFSNSLIPTGYQMIQLNSDTVRSQRRPQRLRDRSHEAVTLQMPPTNEVSHFCLADYKIEASHNALTDLIVHRTQELILTITGYHKEHKWTARWRGM